MVRINFYCFRPVVPLNFHEIVRNFYFRSHSEVSATGIHQFEPDNCLFNDLDNILNTRVADLKEIRTAIKFRNFFKLSLQFIKSCKF